jgi:hypothetical protein
MKPSDRLKEIEIKLVNYHINIEEIDWLIDRVKSLEDREKKLTEALEQISGDCSFGWEFPNICDPICFACLSRKVLEDES